MAARAHHRLRLSTVLQRLAQDGRERVELAELLDVFGDRSFGALLFILAVLSICLALAAPFVLGLAAAAALLADEEPPTTRRRQRRRGAPFPGQNAREHGPRVSRAAWARRALAASPLARLAMATARPPGRRAGSAPAPRAATAESPCRAQVTSTRQALHVARAAHARP